LGKNTFKGLAIADSYVELYIISKVEFAHRYCLPFFQIEAQNYHANAEKNEGIHTGKVPFRL
jgi:hypothetical protein